MRDELLALLEDGRHSADDLAAWLEQPRIAIVHVLNDLAKDGLVRRSGTAKLWVLTSYVAPMGRPAVVDHVAGQRAILAALAKGPLKSRALMAATGLSRNVLRHDCDALLAAGRVQSVGLSRASTWALQGYVRPAAVPPSAVRRQAAGVEPRAPKYRVRPRIVLSRKEREAEAVERLLQIEEPDPVGDSVCERCGMRFMARGGVSGRFCSRRCYEKPRSVPMPVTRVIDGVEYEAVSVGALPLTDWPDDSRGGSSLAGWEYGLKR